PPVPGRASVLVELTGAADAATLAALHTAGAELSFVEGKPLAYGRFVPADVDANAASAIASLSNVARVSLLTGRGPPPLDHSAALVALAEGRGARPMLDTLTGKGVVVADIDTLADIFHPAFFYADAGYFDWIDVNGDGVFTPGVDAIDLNQNG